MAFENTMRVVNNSSANFESDGYLIVENAFSDDFSKQALAAMKRLPDLILRDLGEKKFLTARNGGELELRLPFVYDEFFLSLLEHPTVVESLDAYLPAPTILRYQNVEYHEPEYLRTAPSRTNAEFHWNYPRRLDPLCVLDLVAIFDDSLITGLEIVPRSQRSEARPDFSGAKTLELPANSLLVFNPYLWHRETDNLSDKTRMYVHMQFVRPFMKAHFDFVQALGVERVRQLSPRLQQLLGWNARLPASLQEFYLPAEERFYKSGQW